jgi:hypothetical protein
MKAPMKLESGTGNLQVHRAGADVAVTISTGWGTVANSISRIYLSKADARLLRDELKRLIETINSIEAEREEEARREA